jgi:hypothetical protein
VKNPQNNVFVERVHQVIADSIRKMELSKKPCEDVTINAVLQSVAYGLRATYHSALTATPGQMVFGINSIYWPTGKISQTTEKRKFTKITLPKTNPGSIMTIQLEIPYTSESQIAFTSSGTIPNRACSH